MDGIDWELHGCLHIFDKGYAGTKQCLVFTKYFGFYENAEVSGICGSSSVGRASAFQAECRGFESRLPLQNYIYKYAHVAQ